MSISLPLRPGLEGETPYGAPELDVPVRLNVNENPYPPSPAVIESIATAVAQAATGLNRYPERDFPDLRAALADYLAAESGGRLDPTRIWAANGSNEIMLHVLQAFGGPGRTCLTFTPTYSMYPEYARDTLTEYATRPRRADFTIDAEGAAAAIEELHPAVVVLASPNNPTGTALPLADIQAILGSARGNGPIATVGARGGGDGRPGRTDCVVVIDEAYAEFRRPGVPSALELLVDGANPHLAVTRTMSKAFGAAGLRLGYLAASRELVDALRVVRLPYHLSAAALAALSHREELMAQVAGLREERDVLVDWLRAQGLTAYDSDANFVLFGPFVDRDAIWEQLVAAGVLIRVVGPEGYLRASIGTPQEMDRLRAELLRAMRFG